MVLVVGCHLLSHANINWMDKTRQSINRLPNLENMLSTGREVQRTANATRPPLHALQSKWWLPLMPPCARNHTLHHVQNLWLVMWCQVGLFRSFMGANCLYWDPKVDSSFSKYYFPNHTTRILIWLYWLGWNRIGTHAESSSIWHHTSQKLICRNCDTNGLIPYPAFEGYKSRLTVLWFSPPARQCTKTCSVCSSGSG